MDRADPQTYAILGAAMTAQSKLGPGFLERVYHVALAKELDAAGVPYAREVVLPIFYDEEPLGVFYRADFVCFGDVIVELKPHAERSAADEAQVVNYLKATRFKRALLLHFGGPRLRYKRFVNGL